MNRSMAKARGLQLSASGGRRVRPHDDGPTGDNARRDGVGRASEPARHTGETRFVLTISRVCSFAILGSPIRSQKLLDLPVSSGKRLLSG